MADVNSVVKQRRFDSNALLMPRLEICSCDLHWQWINWTLLCDTMEVSMVRLASLAIAQHVFEPALTGRPESGPELISRNIDSRQREQRRYRGEQISRKIVSRELGPMSYHDFVKNIALMGTKKWSPTCDRAISNSAIYTTAIYWVRWLFYIEVAPRAPFQISDKMSYRKISQSRSCEICI